MGSGKLVLVLLAGATAGALAGILFAPAKGSETRKRIVRKAEDLVDDVKDKFDDLLEVVTAKVEKVKDEVVDYAEKVKNDLTDFAEKKMADTEEAVKNAGKAEA
jgi:gas vesicle protein